MTREELLQSFFEEDLALRREALRAMMLHRATRKFLWFVLEVGNAFGNPNPFSPDPLEMAKQCGRMSAGQDILHELLAVDPEIPLELMKEMQVERAERDEHLRNADGSGGGDNGNWYARDDGDDAPVDFYRRADRSRERKRDELLDRQSNAS